MNTLTMTQQRRAARGFGVLAWLGIGFAVFIAVMLIINPTYTFRFTEEQLQQQIDARLPFEADKHGLRVMVDKGATAEFLDAGRVRVSLPAFSAYPPLAKTTHYAGELVVSGELRYENRAFYLANAEIETLQGEWTVSDRAKVALNIAKNVLDKLATREGEDNSALERLTDPENVKKAATGWVEDLMVHREIYRLEGHGLVQSLLGASLESVTINDTEVQAVLGLRGLMTYVLLMVGLAITALAMTFGIMKSGSTSAVLTLGVLSAFG